jgi:hypothetical protein
MIQLAFDFYDSNCDDRVSEYDLYKVFSYFNDKKWFADAILPDINLISSIITSNGDD